MLKNPYFFYLSVAIALAASLFMFWPGLLGPFVLDDNPNLFYLQAFSQYTDYSLSHYLKDLYLNNKLERIVSFLSFAMQYDDWPNNPFNFKLVNLGIHYLNSFLVFILSYQLAQRFFFTNASQQQLLWFAFFSAFIWLIHPIQHSSIFYAVQRMTLLSSFFMLLGILAYLNLPRKLNLHNFYHWIILTFIIGSLLTLAIFSKGNGLLLTLYLLLIQSLKHGDQSASEHAIKDSPPLYFYFFQTIVIFIPLLLLVVFIASKWDAMHEYNILREFTTLERLLTEARVLIDYLQYMLYPNVYDAGLFHDDFSISRGIFTPISTLFAILVLIGLFVVALVNKTTRPIIYAGILWFLLSHSMESTIIPLEIYFEHRNYLALLGIIWVLIYLAILILKFSKPLMFGISASYLAIVVFFTTQGATIWSSSHNIMVNWSMPKTQSLRATVYSVNFWLQYKDYDKVIAIIDTASQQMPKNLMVRLMQVLYHCEKGTDSAEMISRLIKDIPQSDSFITINSLINPLIKKYKNNQCASLNYLEFKKIIAALIQHPGHNMPAIMTDFYYAAAEIEAKQGNYDTAMALMDKSYAIYPRINIALFQAKWFAQAKHYEKAWYYVQQAEKLANEQKKNISWTAIPEISQQIREMEKAHQE